jgi:hypothetical protein
MVENRASDARRFDGTYSPHKYKSYLHFDSWRLNLRPGVWLPAYIYSEESDRKARTGQTPHFKAQTRLWGYDLRRLAHSNQEFTQIQVDSLQTVRDESESAQDASPIEAERVWERQAEENGVERLQKIGLLAPSGEVDKVLETVVNNLIVTNNLTLLPDIHCRVLLTEPLSALLNSAPQLETRRIDQIAALPFGGRVRLDPWSNRVELLKASGTPIGTREDAF